MHGHRLEEWQHNHVFGQDRKKSGEIRSLIVVALTVVMMVWEILAGVLYGSMALLADGLHMGSHAVALGIAAFAYAYARRNAGNTQFSFGTGKVNALGGFTGAVLLAGFALYMVIESIDRFIHPVEISGYPEYLVDLWVSWGGNNSPLHRIPWLICHSGH